LGTRGTSGGGYYERRGGGKGRRLGSSINEKKRMKGRGGGVNRVAGDSERLPRRGERVETLLPRFQEKRGTPHATLDKGGRDLERRRGGES